MLADTIIFRIYRVEDFEQTKLADVKITMAYVGKVVLGDFKLLAV